MPNQKVTQCLGVLPIFGGDRPSLAGVIHLRGENKSHSIKKKKKKINKEVAKTYQNSRRKRRLKVARSSKSFRLSFIIKNLNDFDASF